MSRTTHFKDPLHGIITVVEHANGMMMTNAKPDTQGRWVKRGNTFTYMPYSKKQKGKIQQGRR